MPKRTYGSITVETSNEDKVLFPEAKLTKGDLLDYYERVADTLLPHIDGRPLSMHRYPDGIHAEGFYQKEVPDYFPDWIDRVEVTKKEGGSQTQVVCRNAASLVYLANQACITPHAWLSREEDLDRPDRLIFDLDAPAAEFDRIRQAARWLRDLLEDLDLRSFIMLTGSRGVHVVVPLRPEATFDEIRGFARQVAVTLAQRHPDALTVEQRKDKRGERLFLDTARNAYAQTAVTPYSVRARPGAPVATPIDWVELGDANLGSARYTIQNLFRRLAQKEDPWARIDHRALVIGEAQERLARIREG